MFGVTADALPGEGLLAERSTDSGSGAAEPRGTNGKNASREQSAAEKEEEARMREEREKRAPARDLRRTNLGPPVRFAFPAACVSLHSWRYTGDPGHRFSFLLPGGICVAGMAWWNHGWYLRERGSRTLLKWDMVLVVLGILVSRILAGISRGALPGVIPGVIPGAVVIAGPIRTLLADHCRVELPGRPDRLFRGHAPRGCAPRNGDGGAE